MIGAQVLHAPMSRSLQNTLWLWVGCMLGGLLVFVIAPLLGPQARLLTGGWGWYQVIAGLTALGCFLFLCGVSRIRFAEREPVISRLQRSGHPPSVFLFLRSVVCRLASGVQFLSSVVCRPSSALPPRVLAATALFYIGGLTILFPMVDRVKSYGPAFRAMAACVADDPSACVAGATHVAGWRFDETTRAGFYYYCDLVFPPLSDINDLNQVLGRRHSRFDGVLALSRNFPPKRVCLRHDPPKADPPMEGPPESESLPPWRVRAEVRMGPRRVVQWIEGAVVAQPTN